MELILICSFIMGTISNVLGWLVYRKLSWKWYALWLSVLIVLIVGVG